MLWRIGNFKLEFSSKMLENERIKEFFNFLEQCEVNYQTLVNYNKSLTHLFKYFLRITNLNSEDRQIGV